MEVHNMEFHHHHHHHRNTSILYNHGSNRTHETTTTIEVEQPQQLQDLIDYGYEDHCPDIHLRYEENDEEEGVHYDLDNDGDDVDEDDDDENYRNDPYIDRTFIVPNNNTKNIIMTGSTTISTIGKTTTAVVDATEVSQSPTQRSKDTTTIWSRIHNNIHNQYDINTTTTNNIENRGNLLNTHNNSNSDDDDSVLIDSVTGADQNDDDDDDDLIRYNTVVQAAMNTVALKMKQEQQQPNVPDMNHDYPPMPPDRMARKQRSFHRRGGEAHNALLKSAVLASMSFDTATFDDDDDDDDESFCNDNTNSDKSKAKTKLSKANRFRTARRESAHSSISLQSLQDALRASSSSTDLMGNNTTSTTGGTSSPRKRARRGGNEITNQQDMIEASDLFVTMRVGSSDEDGQGKIDDGENNNVNIYRNRSNSTTSGDPTHNSMLILGRNSGSSHFHSSISSTTSDLSINNIAAAAQFVQKQRQQQQQQREAPPRRVSRKTSYDSRASDYDSDFDTDEWDI